MSKLEVNAVEPQCGTNLTLGASGDTIIIPSGATISNQGTAAGFGPTGAVSWNTTKITADPNPAVSGVGYFADTTSAAFTITLPSSPSAGAVVGIADYANTFATNNLTIGRNGSNILGVAANSVLSTNGVSVTLVYVDATQGWIITDSGSRADVPVPNYVTATGGTITCDGDFKVHTFTGPGTFTVTSAGNPLGSTTVDYLVIAGGGSGGLNKAGGGGAGGFRQNFPSPAIAGLPVSVQGYPITVGAGGSSTPTKGGSGTNSVFSTITSAGGGGGGSANSCNPDPPTRVGISGGSGGGGAGNDSPGNEGPGGAGNTPPTSPSQGNAGGNGTHVNPGTASAGGGGGAGGAGVNGPPSVGGAGGNGSANSITGSPVTYAGGGGGGVRGINGGSAGPGGGGAGGGDNNAQIGSPGSVNTGGGGGGAGQTGSLPTVGTGGSGIVIIRYKFQN